MGGQTSQCSSECCAESRDGLSGRAGNRVPSGGITTLTSIEPSRWQVVNDSGCAVRIQVDTQAAAICTKKHGSVLIGKLAHVGDQDWLTLTQEPGFIVINHGGIVYLQEIPEGEPRDPIDPPADFFTQKQAPAWGRTQTSASRSINYFSRDADEVVTMLDLQFEALDCDKRKQLSGFKEMRIRRCHTYTSGSVYEGEWMGAPASAVVRHGFGRTTWPDGAIYEGQWADNRAHGRGRFIHPCGDVYIGQWHLNKANGIGQYYQKGDSAVYDGEWKMDIQSGHGVECVSSGMRYEGQFVNGQKDGFGVYFWPDGSEYSGAWQADVIEGVGSFQSPEGRTYKGRWHGSVMHGIGCFMWQDGRSYAGEYLMDKKEGFGVFKWRDGRRYTGFWASGKQHGRGIFTSADGKHEAGIWSEGIRK